MDKAAVAPHLVGGFRATQQSAILGLSQAGLAFLDSVFLDSANRGSKIFRKNCLYGMCIFYSPLILKPYGTVIDYIALTLHFISTGDLFYMRGCGQRLCQCHIAFYTRDLHTFRFGYLGIIGQNSTHASRGNATVPHTYSGCQLPCNPDDDPVYVHFIDMVTGAQRSPCPLFLAFLSLFPDITTAV